MKQQPKTGGKRRDELLYRKTLFPRKKETMQGEQKGGNSSGLKTNSKPV